jgi:hypothetical protein
MVTYRGHVRHEDINGWRNVQREKFRLLCSSLILLNKEYVVGWNYSTHGENENGYEIPNIKSPGTTPVGVLRYRLEKKRWKVKV